MADVKYIYRVNASIYSLQVEVAIFDPDRYDGKGGARFGFEAEVSCYAGSEQFPDRTKVGCSQGSIGTHSPEDAALRIDVYQQAADIARFVRDRLVVGMTLVEIGTYLSETLATTPETATKNRWAVHV